MATLRRDMIGAGMAPGGLVARGGGSSRHFHGAEGLAEPVAGLGTEADDAQTKLVQMTVDELLTQAQNTANAVPSQAASGELARRLKEDTFPRLYTYIAAPVALGLGLILGYAIGK